MSDWRCRRVRPEEIEKLRVPAQSLEPSERLYRVWAAPVVWLHDKRFAFSEDKDARTAIIFVCRDDLGDVVDMAAWAPSDDKLGTMEGRVCVLGQENILAPRLGEALRVHPTPREWLADGRQGVVVIDAVESLPLLYAGSPIAVSSAQQKKSLHDAWRVHVPRITVATTTPVMPT